MNIKQKVITVVCAIALVAGGLLFAGHSTAPENGNLNNITPAADNSQKETISVKIIFGEQDVADFEAQTTASSTAMSVLEQAVSALEFDLQTKDYGEMGVLVEKIGDKKNGDEGSYWMYYINGQLAGVGADKQAVKAGDIVEWRFEKPSF